MDRQVDGGIHNIPWLKQSVYRQLVKALIRHKMHNPGPAEPEYALSLQTV